MSVFVRSGNTSRLIDEHNAIVTASASHPPLSNSPSQAARPRPEPVVRSSTPDANNTCDASQSLRGVGVEVSQGRRAGALTVFFSMPSSLHSKPRPGALGIAMLPSLSGQRGSPRTRSSKLFRPAQAPLPRSAHPVIQGHPRLSDLSSSTFEWSFRAECA